MSNLDCITSRRIPSAMREFTIVADFVYPPENVDPDDAIILTPGVEYGLLSGYEGLSQYFKVEVPQGTERLVVDLNDGAGDASLYMRLDQAPTTSTYDHHSTAEGANDRIAFNDPTPVGGTSSHLRNRRLRA